MGTRDAVEGVGISFSTFSSSLITGVGAAALRRFFLVGSKTFKSYLPSSAMVLLTVQGVQSDFTRIPLKNQPQGMRGRKRLGEPVRETCPADGGRLGARLALTPLCAGTWPLRACSTFSSHECTRARVMVSRLRCFAALLAAMALLQSVSAMWITLKEGEKRCFFEEIPANTAISGQFESHALPRPELLGSSKNEARPGESPFAPVPFSRHPSCGPTFIYSKL